MLQRNIELQLLLHQMQKILVRFVLSPHKCQSLMISHQYTQIAALAQCVHTRDVIARVCANYGLVTVHKLH